MEDVLEKDDVVQYERFRFGNGTFDDFKDYLALLEKALFLKTKVKRAETEEGMDGQLDIGLEQIERNAYDADYDQTTFTVGSTVSASAEKSSK